MSIQLFKDNNDLCVVFKNIDSTIEESLIKVFSSFLKNDIKEVPELIPLKEEEITPPVLNDEKEIPIVEKPLFLQEENLINAPINSLNDFIYHLSDKSRFDDLLEYYKINKNIIEKLNFSTNDLKQMITKIYKVCPDLIQKSMSEKAFDSFEDFIEVCKGITIRKLIRASLNLYFKKIN